MTTKAQTEMPSTAMMKIREATSIPSKSHELNDAELNQASGGLTPDKVEPGGENIRRSN